MSEAKTYGAWKISEAEYRAARALAKNDEGHHSEDAYQLVAYCEGRPFYRDAAERAAQFIREL